MEHGQVGEGKGCRIDTGEKHLQQRWWGGKEISLGWAWENQKDLKEERDIFFSCLLLSNIPQIHPLNYFHHQNVKPYPMTLPIPLLLNVQNNSLHPSVSSLTKVVFWNDHYLLDCPSISNLNLGYIINIDISSRIISGFAGLSSWSFLYVAK